MAKKEFHYLLTLEFLGFRFHGFAKQKDLLTIQGVLDKTIIYNYPELSFRTIAASRTDAKVSALDLKVALYSDQELDLKSLQLTLDDHSPQDVRVKDVEILDPKVNIIQNAKRKTYRYYFCKKEVFTPFMAPYIACHFDDFETEKMMKAAPHFIGSHDFKEFCYRKLELESYQRKIEACSITQSTPFSADIFHDHIYCFEVIGEGFLRYQVRMMMGALFALGNGKLTFDQIEKSLSGNYQDLEYKKAQASGLLLYKTDFITS